MNADVPPLVTIGDMPPVGATGAVPPVVTTTSAVPPVVTTSAVPPVVTSSSGGLNAPPITTTAGASTHVNPGQYPWLLPGWTGQASFPGGQASFAGHAFPGGPASFTGGQCLHQPHMPLSGFPFSQMPSYTYPGFMDSIMHFILF